MDFFDIIERGEDSKINKKQQKSEFKIKFDTAIKNSSITGNVHRVKRSLRHLQIFGGQHKTWDHDSTFIYRNHFQGTIIPWPCNIKTTEMIRRDQCFGNSIGILQFLCTNGMRPGGEWGAGKIIHFIPSFRLPGNYFGEMTVAAQEDDTINFIR